jgi:energy-coupling factor transporter ATP-binding protein EcfA2
LPRSAITVHILATQSIVLLGLPGCGKSKVAKSLNKQFSVSLYGEITESDLMQSTRPGCFEWQNFTKPPKPEKDAQVWCVIDVRSTLPDSSWLEGYLTQLLSTADGIVFSFVEQASLQEQAWWNKWLTQVFRQLNRKKPPITRWLNQEFPSGFTGFSKMEVVSSELSDNPLYEHSAMQIETFRFEVGKVVLDHLLMGLDNSRQNLGMKITRVLGVVETLEYENLVELQCSALRWDMYASESEKPTGFIEISGIELDQAWLSQIVHASKL